MANKPGQKLGRPAGAPRVKGRHEVLGIDGRMAAMRHASKAMETIADLLTSPMHTVRLGAATYIIDRAYGKAKQEVELSGEVQHNHSVEVEAERFRSTMARLIANAEAERDIIDIQPGVSGEAGDGLEFSRKE